MNNLTGERCFNHSVREAAARCPACGRCYCRECVTEHDGRVMCSACLRVVATVGERRRARCAALRLAAAGVVGLCVAYQLFLWLGLALSRLPTIFHEGSAWTMAPVEKSK